MTEIEDVRVPPVAMRTSRMTEPATAFLLSISEDVPLIFRNFLIASKEKTKVLQRRLGTRSILFDWPMAATLVTDDVLMAMEIGLELTDPIVKRATCSEVANPLLCLDYQSILTPSYKHATTVQYLKNYGFRESSLRSERSPFSGLPTQGFIVKVVHLDRFYVYVRDYDEKVRLIDELLKIDTARMWGEPFTSAHDEEDLQNIIFDIRMMFEETSDELPF